MCEDYPCCGHGDGGCPNQDGTFNCATCGGKLSKHAESSICEKCQRRHRDNYEHLDWDYSMNS